MKSVLVVDDSKDITELVKAILEPYGYSCITANSGQQCLEIVDEQKFDLILLDLAMPEFSGVDVLKQLKQDDKLTQNKIVLFTASPSFTETDIDNLKKEYGILKWLKKPFKKKEILEIIENNIA